MISERRRQIAPVLNAAYSNVLEYDKEYEGQVVDRIDAFGIGRVKVNIPELMTSTTDAIWARPIKQFQGEHIVPALNMWLVIKFMYGDPMNPVFTGHSTKFHDVLSSEGVPKGDVVASPVDNAKILADSYSLLLTPQKEHNIRAVDNDKYNYIEVSTGGDNSLYMSDSNGGHIGIVSAAKYAMMISDSSSYIEMVSPKGSSIKIDDQAQAVGVMGANGAGLIISNSADSFVLGNSAGVGGTSLTDNTIGDSLNSPMDPTNIKIKTMSNLGSAVSAATGNLSSGQKIIGTPSYLAMVSNGAKIIMTNGHVLINP